MAEVLAVFLVAGTTGALGTFLFKVGAEKLGEISWSVGNVGDVLLRLGSNWQIVVGAGLYVVSSVVYIRLLQVTEVSRSYPVIVAYMVLLVFVFGSVFLKEPVTVFKVLGVVLVITGVYFLSR